MKLNKSRPVDIIISLTLVFAFTVGAIVLWEEGAMAKEAEQCRAGNLEACRMVKDTYRAKASDKFFAREALDSR